MRFAELQLHGVAADGYGVEQGGLCFQCAVEKVGSRAVNLDAGQVGGSVGRAAQVNGHAAYGRAALESAYLQVGTHDDAVGIARRHGEETLYGVGRLDADGGVQVAAFKAELASGVGGVAAPAVADDAVLVARAALMELFRAGDDDVEVVLAVDGLDLPARLRLGADGIEGGIDANYLRARGVDVDASRAAQTRL